MFYDTYLSHKACVFFVADQSTANHNDNILIYKDNILFY